jgi:membrane-bound inhibitor of C-type lysozyme
LTLPQTMSGSGIRYASDNDAVVFWSKGNTAFVTEGGDPDNVTYDGCVPME